MAVISKGKKAPLVLDLDVIEAELKRVDRRDNYLKALKATLFSLVVVIAAAALSAVLFFPVVQIVGNSMNDTLYDGDIVWSVKERNYTSGDVIAFYYNNDIFVKRVIAAAGDWVDIDADGNVSVNGEQIDEPYVSGKALGSCDIKLPYQVPEGKIFVMGDHRSVSIDSRNTAIGCVEDNKIVGKLVFRFWPLQNIGFVS